VHASPNSRFLQVLARAGWATGASRRFLHKQHMQHAWNDIASAIKRALLCPKLGRGLTKPKRTRRRLWFWLGVIILSISVSLWLICALGAAINPEIDRVDLIVELVTLTFIPIVLGIFCLNRGRKPRRTLESKLIRQAKRALFISWPFDPAFNPHFLSPFFRFGHFSLGVKSDSPAGEGVGVRFLHEMRECQLAGRQEPYYLS